MIVDSIFIFHSPYRTRFKPLLNCDMQSKDPDPGSHERAAGFHGRPLLHAVLQDPDDHEGS